MSESERPEPGLYSVDAVSSVPVEKSIVVEPPGVEIPPPARRRYGRWFACLVLAFFGAALAYDAVRFLQSLFDASALAGIAASVLLAAALVTGALWIVDEMRRFYAMRTADSIRAAAARLRGSASRDESLALVNQILPALRGNVAAHDRSARLRDRLRHTHDGADVLNLFVREVLEPLDQQAAARISRAARDTALGVAASPVGALDAVIGTVRALRMVREIATIYGLRPGTFGAMRLMKRALLDGASFGAADLASDVWTDLLSGVGLRATGMVAGKLGEGVFAAVRVTRLGLATMQACRPIPFADEQRLAALRREMVTQVFTGLVPRWRRQALKAAPPGT
jgi:putative membrane protein